MAKDNAKKNWKKNEVRMKVFTIITILVNALYIGLILYRRSGYIRFRDLTAIAFWAGQEYFYLSALKKIAQPSFAADGSLMSCIDASNPAELGLYTFAQDALWVCWVVQTLCCCHFAFFVFYLPVPATLIYKAFGLLRPFLPSWLQKGGGEEVDGEEGASSSSPTTREERRREAIQRRKGKHQK